MNQEMTHERCSELLIPLHQGRLDDALAQATREHLEGCSSCREELAAVRALGAPAGDPLTRLEAARLRRSVWEEVRPATVVVARTPFRARFGAMAGAAAAVVLLLGGGAWLLLGGGGSGDGAGGPVGADSGAAIPGSAPRESAAGSGRTEEEGALQKDRSLTNFASAAAPTFAPAPTTLGDAFLRRIGRSGVFLNLAHDLAGHGTARSEQRFLDDLAAQAPEDLAPQVRECGAQTITLSLTPVVPAYATTGRLSGEDVLVLGFASGRSPRGPLDRFLFLAWTRGSCASIVHDLDGPIGKG